MSRSQRLIELLQVLRRHRRPVSGQMLAEETGISLRTLYRDIAALQAQGADIEGEAGIGYVLKPGFLLPPLMFSEDELEALVLGARWVSTRTDAGLEKAAANLLAKIHAVLPEDMRERMDGNNLMVGPSPPSLAERPRVNIADIRKAIRQEEIIQILYTDSHGIGTKREIWPFALGFFEKVRVMVGWCVLRQGFRHFRADRIEQLDLTGKRYPRRKAHLLKAWKVEQGIPPKNTTDRI